MRKAIIATMALALCNLSYAGNDALKSKIINKLTTRTQSSTNSSADRLMLIYGGKDITTNTRVASVDVEETDNYFIEGVLA